MSRYGIFSLMVRSPVPCLVIAFSARSLSCHVLCLSRSKSCVQYRGLPLKLFFSCHMLRGPAQRVACLLLWFGAGVLLVVTRCIFLRDRPCVHYRGLVVFSGAKGFVCDAVFCFWQSFGSRSRCLCFLTWFALGVSLVVACRVVPPDRSSFRKFLFFASF